MIASLFVILLVFVTAVVLVGYLLSAPRYSGPVTDHFDGRRFRNPGDARANGFPEVLKWMVNRKLGAWKEITDPAYGPKPESVINEGARITFVNHSTFLIQVNGVNILTDPVWSKRTSPFEWAGPRRMRHPGLRLEDLPKVDVLLLSHNHWDHLDIRTVKHIYDVHRPRIVSPLGVKAFLDSERVLGAVDLDWWDELELPGGLVVQSVPAQHFSGRGTFDRDATLWCGYVVRRKEGNLYFAGDTGYNATIFNEIGSRCAPISIALIPIGAYKPAWFMSPIHCSPAEAVRIHQEVGAQTSIATHFGTFPLADDGQHEPTEELKLALRESGIDPASFRVLEEGTPEDF